jgi:hypothetical protein
MLHNKDYILRLIEQLGRALSRILSTLLSRPVDELAETREELDAIALQVGLDLDLANRLALDSLSIMVAPGGTPDPGRCWLLAELLFLRGLHEERVEGPGFARQSFDRSLFLYRQVEPEWKAEIDLPAAEGRIEELERRLGDAPASPSEADP